MVRRDKIGLAVLLSLFAAFVIILVSTIRPASKGNKDVSDSYFVKQRIINLQKGK